VHPPRGKGEGIIVGFGGRAKVGQHKEIHELDQGNKRSLVLYKEEIVGGKKNWVGVRVFI
jgi:hypothetical protein